MSLFLPIFLASFLVSSSGICSKSIHDQPASSKNLDFDSSCPIDFTLDVKMLKKGCCDFHGFLSVTTACHYIIQSIRYYRSNYLRTTGHFVLPAHSSEACWKSFQSLLNLYSLHLDVRSTCSVPTTWVSNDCTKVTTRLEFEALVPESKMQSVRILCNQSLAERSACEPCLSILSDIQGAYFNATGAGDLADCAGYANMYAAAFVNQAGLLDYGTMTCLFSIYFYPHGIESGNHKVVTHWVPVGCALALLGMIVAVVWFLRHKWFEHLEKKRGDSTKVGSIPNLELEFLGTGLVKYTLEEMKEATRNFSRANLIGKGGYGNVYKGILPNGYEVALKRFKNCSASGDANFAHEIEVIASVQHINLVTLRGYCIATDVIGNHQRIIVCDLVHNGSLHDHLFGLKSTNRLAWPIRKKIALGTARGLAYLHNGARTSIIHRDIKVSNILLDETFEPKLADFGLAKFTPDGISHLSTKVAGTLGYVAPEYALYGQLTERSDVYSFGVVLLQLLSGKEAVVSMENGEASLLVDWAWELMRKGKALDIIEGDMPGLEMAEVMERYVVVAILSAHPLLHARPTMEQIVNILESAQVDTENFQRLNSDLRSFHVQSYNSMDGCSSLDHHREENSSLSCNASQLNAQMSIRF
ncbi:Non-specific serine/threonine protein kinase [Bertholletia excelsa]